jgi:transcriptional regulator with XRE-family HTH domain
MPALTESDVFRINPKKVTALRTAKGWSIDDLVHHARNMGVRLSRQTIVDLENGTSRGRVDTLGKLKLVFKVRADDLLIDD